MWLDALPPDVLSRVASYVVSEATSHKNHSENTSHWVLLLAETNEVLRGAVLSALSYTLKMDECSEHPARWTSVFLPGVRVLIFGENRPHWQRLFAGVPLHPHPLSLLKAPTLLRAEISCEPDVLQAVAGSMSVRELCVHIRTEGPHELLLDTLKTLRLEKLELRCQVEYKHRIRCPFNEMICRHPAADALSVCCPGLQSLEIKCHRRDHWNARIGFKDPLWRVVPTLPALREVTVSSEVPDHALEMLRGIESVNITGTPNAFDLALRLGTSVTCLHTLKSLDSEEVAALARCPRLKDLAINLSEGAEGAFKEAMAAMTSLRSLKIRWARPEAWTARTHKWNIGQFTTAAPGTLLRVVESSPDLVKLQLDYVRIGLKELTGMLGFMGRRLQHFGVSIFDQDEPPFERLEAIIHALTKYNAELEFFHVEWSRGDDEEMLRMVRAQAGESRRRRDRIRAGLRRLKRRAPRFETNFLEVWIDSFVNCDDDDTMESEQAAA